MFRGHGETHRGVDGSVGGGRHRGVQGAPDGHWGHLIHTPACVHMSDNTWTRIILNFMILLVYNAGRLKIFLYTCFAMLLHTYIKRSNKEVRNILYSKSKNYLYSKWEVT